MVPSQTLICWIVLSISEVVSYIWLSCWVSCSGVSSQESVLALLLVNIMASWCTWMPRCNIKPMAIPSSSSFSLILDLFFFHLKKKQSSISGLCHRNMFVTLHHFELHNIKENQCFDNLIWKGCRNSHHYESQQRGMEKMVIFKQQSFESRGRCKVDASATSSNKPQLHNCYVALQNIFSWGYEEEWKILGVKRKCGRRKRL